MTPEQERLLIQINEDFEGYHRDVNAGLRIKHMPDGPGFRLRDLELYEKFLDSTPADRAEFMTKVHPDEIEFFQELLMSRIEYEIAEEKSGSITQNRVDRNPERYRWKHEK